MQDIRLWQVRPRCVGGVGDQVCMGAGIRWAVIQLQCAVLCYQDQSLLGNRVPVVPLFSIHSVSQSQVQNAS